VRPVIYFVLTSRHTSMQFHPAILIHGGPLNLDDLGGATAVSPFLVQLEFAYGSAIERSLLLLLVAWR